MANFSTTDIYMGAGHYSDDGQVYWRSTTIARRPILLSHRLQFLFQQTIRALMQTVQDTVTRVIEQALMVSIT